MLLGPVGARKWGSWCFGGSYEVMRNGDLRRPTRNLSKETGNLRIIAGDSSARTARIDICAVISSTKLEIYVSILEI